MLLTENRVTHFIEIWVDKSTFALKKLFEKYCLQNVDHFLLNSPWNNIFAWKKPWILSFPNCGNPEYHCLNVLWLSAMHVFKLWIQEWVSLIGLSTIQCLELSQLEKIPSKGAIMGAWFWCYCGKLMGLPKILNLDLNSMPRGPFY